MANLWLYAIAERGGLYFEFSGKKLPVSVKSYGQLLKNRKLKEDHWWYITQHWRNVRLNDVVLIYTGDDDLGIIGYATVIGVDWRSDYKSWAIHLNFDFRRSSQLFHRRLVPARVVRKWVHYPRRNIINMNRFRSKLSRHLPK